MNECICNKPSIKLLGSIRNLFKDIKNNGGFNKVPKALVHYDFSKYTNEEFLTYENKLVKDLSGNGHDLRLYNFAFNEMSGFGGYSEDYTRFIENKANATYNKIIGSIGDNVCSCLFVGTSRISGHKIKVSGLTDNKIINYYYYPTEENVRTSIQFSNGIYDVPESVASDAHTSFVGFFIQQGTKEVVIEQLPAYEGALVSDGVDDYGLCVKDFALPDDYTICLIRANLEDSDYNIEYTAAKSREAGQGAFVIDGISGTNYDGRNYGAEILNQPVPPLFIYQSKLEFNGTPIQTGIGTDTEDDKLYIFRLRENIDRFRKVALYELRIFDHSLTEDELLLVKDDMMRNYERNAKPLDGITYVADWDAKGRSNDEDADVRNKWVDKTTGKVINLNNFVYAGMSGWNGYTINFNSLNVSVGGNIFDRTGDKFTIVNTTGSLTSSILYTDYFINFFKIRVSGITDGDIRISSRNSVEWEIVIIKDGEYEIPSSSTGFQIRSNTLRESCNIVIEQLPLYPGSLVSDGIDDYGVSQEVIDEPIKTVLVMFDILNYAPSKQWNILFQLLNASVRTMLTTPSHDYIAFYDGFSKQIPYVTNELRIEYASRTLDNSEGELNIFSISNNISFALYRLIFIKEQLNDQQLDFLKWKVDKEYRDWLKRNNYQISK